MEHSFFEKVTYDSDVIKGLYTSPDNFKKQMTSNLVHSGKYKQLKKMREACLEQDTEDTGRIGKENLNIILSDNQ